MNFTVERSITVKAPVKKVKDLVLDFKQWHSWSPWTIAEPDCKIVIKGKPGEVGHKMSWDGEIIGTGENTLAKVSDKRLDYDLEFLKPWKSKAQTAFVFRKTKAGTKVTWTMDSSLPFFMFFMIPMMKGWISMDYDRGLRMLKAMAEVGKVNAKTTNKGSVDLAGFSYVGVQRTVSFDELGEVMQKDFDTLYAMLEQHNRTAKHWLALYPKMNMGAMTMTHIAAVSDEDLKDINLGDEYVTGEVPMGKALEVAHKGAYDFLGNAWSMGMMYLRAKKMKQRGVPFELYLNNPKEVAPEKLKTSVYFPVR